MPPAYLSHLSVLQTGLILNGKVKPFESKARKTKLWQRKIVTEILPEYHNQLWNHCIFLNCKFWFLTVIGTLPSITYADRAFLRNLTLFVFPVAYNWNVRFSYSFLETYQISLLAVPFLCCVLYLKGKFYSYLRLPGFWSKQGTLHLKWEIKECHHCFICFQHFL